jgi:hypothetical protein
MNKYRFTQDYTTNVSVGGFVGIQSKTFKSNEIFDGVDKGGDSIEIKWSTNANALLLQGASEFVNVPKNVVQLVGANETKSTNNSSSTNNKNVLPFILIGVIGASLLFIGFGGKKLFQ